MLALWRTAPTASWLRLSLLKCTTKYFPGAAPTSLVRSSSEHSTPIVVGQSTLESSCWPSMLPGIFLTEGWDLFNPLNSSGTAEEKLTWAFKMYDIDGNGQIDFNELKRWETNLYLFLTRSSEAQAYKSIYNSLISFNMRFWSVSFSIKGVKLLKVQKL